MKDIIRIGIIQVQNEIIEQRKMYADGIFSELDDDKFATRE